MIVSCYFVYILFYAVIIEIKRIELKLENKLIE